jgi:predicted phosphodiesterase
VSGPLDPRRTAELLVAANIPTIAGNHDRYVTAEAAPRGAVDRFARAALDSSSFDWLAALPETRVVADRIFMCHGTPASLEAPWLDGWMEGRRATLPDEAAVAAAAEGFDYPVLLCGHTHVPRAVRLRDGRLVVNPGSVGLQMNYGSPDARYALLEQRGGTWSVSLNFVPYDHAAAARQAAANGFAHWGEALSTGWVGAAGLF